MGRGRGSGGREGGEGSSERDLPEAVEQQALVETLALRREEQRDIEAAIASLRRSAAPSVKRRRPSTSESHAAASSAEWDALTREKAEIEAAILSMEREQERAEAERDDVARLKQALEQQTRERRQVQATLEGRKTRLTRLKDKMRRMVQQMPTTEAVLLQLLFEHAGEMGVAELKAEAATRLQGPEHNTGAVVRALYSLVAHGVVQIDRSVGSGLVTSLLV
ncbi:hypothetical protein PINS_up003265 [Pythium insidiosum]|nr:hypothetical protein PINS_up003265 [Pythium insidiosum]